MIEFVNEYIYVINGLTWVACFNLFLIFVITPLFASLNGKGYWDTIEDYVFESTFHFFAILIFVAVIVYRIVLGVMYL
ncbi:hypothetical protein D3C81_1459490 [compost metagenome]